MEPAKQIGHSDVSCHGYGRAEVVLNQKNDSLFKAFFDRLLSCVAQFGSFLCEWVA